MGTTLGEPRTVTLENELLRVVVLPDAGAKIYSLVHKPTGKEILWHNPNVPVQAASPGSSYDDLWAGGWDELFPNDEPASMRGRSYPDHGELWTASWDCSEHESGDGKTVYLRTDCEVARCRVEKWITLADGESRIRFRHRLTNLAEEPLECLWKLHPALAVAPGDRMLIPASRFQLEPAFLGTLEGGALESDNPVLVLPGRTVDLHVVPPPESREVYFYYGLDLSDGWCAAYDPRLQLAVAWAFPKEIFRSCWLFASYGGWRDHYVGVLEPCTAWPIRLEDAAAAGTCLVLPPLGVQEANMVCSLRQGVPGVSRVSPEGEIE